MYSGKRKLIGVFTNNMEKSSFQHKVCVAVSRLTEERGYDAAIFNTFGNQISWGVYGELEIRLVDLAPIEKMDAIIILTDTFTIPEQRTYMLTQVRDRRRSDCPVVNIRSGIKYCDEILGAGNYFNIGVDQEKQFEELLEHAIGYHGLKNPCYMSGPEDHEDAIARLKIFRSVCERHDIKLHEHSIFYGDFWRGKGRQAIKFFFEDNNEPDGLICANDYMAVDMLVRLIQMGKRVPEDLIVTGFDDLPEASCCSPSLTTMGPDFTEMTRLAIDVAEKYWNGIEQPMMYSVEPKFKGRESCGCNITDTHSFRLVHNEMIEDNKVTYMKQIEMTYTYLDMTDCRDLEEFVNVARSAIEMYHESDSVYLCLCTDNGSDDISSTKFTQEFKDKLIVALSQRDGVSTDYYDIPEHERVFLKKDLLPKMAERDEPTCYYYLMLHNKKVCLGYIAISFKDHSIYDFNFQCRVISYAVGLTEMINRVRLDRERAINEKMSITDTLTHLFNRRGFEDRSSKLINTLDSAKEDICVISVDLNGLKQINDRFGHAEGDFAIRTVGEAISGLAGERGIAARMGGDEFIVMLPVEKGDKQRDFAAILEKKLKEMSSQAAKSYDIGASVGVEFGTVENNRKLKDIMRRSDEKLYNAKRKLKRRMSDTSENKG